MTSMTQLPGRKWMSRQNCKKNQHPFRNFVITAIRFQICQFWSQWILNVDGGPIS